MDQMLRNVSEDPRIGDVLFNGKDTIVIEDISHPPGKVSRVWYTEIPVINTEGTCPECTNTATLPVWKDQSAAWKVLVRAEDYIS